MHIHRPWGGGYGNSEDLRACADQLDVLAEASFQLYMHRAKNITEDELREMMKKGTELDPERCLELGFCDVVDTYDAIKSDDPPPEAKQPATNQQLEDIKTMLQSLKEPPEQKQTPPVEETDDDKNKPNFLGVLAEAIKKGA